MEPFNAGSAEPILTIAENTARAYGIDPDLLIAIITGVEDCRLDPWVVRYEPRWTFYNNPTGWAGLNGVSVQTEMICQSMSWGPAQIMGATARDMGWQGPITQLTDPAISLRFSVLRLKHLSQIYENEDKVISAYNNGNGAKLPTGEFTNQDYVDKVKAKLAAIRVGTAR